jgi:hypothetical protein
MIRGGSIKIPYASEQGIFSVDQGIKVPCSAENRDKSRLNAPPARRFPERKRGKAEKTGVQAIETTSRDPVVHA